MTFLAPVFFWSFLSLIPLAAIYFLKVRPARKLTPAYFLWSRVFTEKKANSLFHRMRDALSLLLMALAFGCVGMALTRPETSADERRDLILLLDTSASMGAGAGQEQRMHLAVEAARELIQGLDATQRASLATVSREVRFLSHLTDDPRSLLDALEGVTPSPYPLRREALASLQAGDSAEWMRHHRLILVTDGCFEGEPPPGMEILKVGPPLENTGIVAADAAYLPGPDRVLAVYLQFASSWKSPVTGELTLRHVESGALGKVVSVSLNPGVNPGAVFQITDATPGKWLASLRLPDAREDDNTASLVAREPSAVRVGVTGEEGFFYRAAVEAFHRGDSLLALDQDRPQITLSHGAAPAAAPGRSSVPGILFQPAGPSPWTGTPGALLENPVVRVRVPDHPVLRHLDSAGMSFAGARALEAPAGALVLLESDQKIPLLYLATAEGRTMLVVNMDPAAAEFYFSPWFPLLIHGAATHLAGQAELLASNYQPGSEIPVPGVTSASATTSITRPDGSLSSATGTRTAPLEEPGFYTLTNASGQWLAAVNALSPSETLLDNSRTTNTLAPISRGLPPYLLLTLLGLAVLIAESLLYHRRKVG